MRFSPYPTERSVRLSRDQRDWIDKLLFNSILAVTFAAVLAIPWHGFLPVIAVCGGIIAACVAFKLYVEK